MEYHPHEVQILKNLTSKSTAHDLAEKSGLPLDAVLRASSWLSTKNLVTLEESLTTEIARLGELASVDQANPHKFRHTFATELYSITGDIRLVQKMLGHSNIQTTTIYEHTAGVDRKGFMEDYQNEIDSLVGGMI